VLTVLVGMGILLIGYLIKYRGWTGLISETTAMVTPGGEGTAVAAGVVGNVTLVVGEFVLVLGGLEAVGLAALLPEWVILLLLLVGAVVLIAPRLDPTLDAD
jgi:hypothetical protein